jgi:hypothetical protein
MEDRRDLTPEERSLIGRKGGFSKWSNVPRADRGKVT